jgi:hypothetical protein
MRIFLAVVAAYDTVGSSAKTLYFGTAGYTSGPGDTPAHTYFEPRIKQPASLRRDIFAPGTTQGPSRVATGDLVLLNPDGALDYLLDYAFDGRVITVYTGEDDGAFPSGFAELLVGTMEQAEFTRTEVRLKIRDRQAELDVPLQGTLYAGDNTLPAGLEGVADLKGKPKPVCYGVVKNISPPCVNTSKLIYQVNDGAVVAIPDVRDSGITLAYTLRGATLASSPGFSGAVTCSAYGAGLFVAADSVGTIQSSPTGATWTSRSTEVSGSCSAAAFGDRFMVVGYDGSMPNEAQARYSTDGITWTTADVTDVWDGEHLLQGVCYNDVTGRWFAGSDTGIVGYSDNGGVDWTDAGYSGGAVIAMVAGRGVVLAVQADAAHYSTDNGANWAEATIPRPAGSTVYAGKYAGGQFVLCGSGPAFVLVSVNGINWTYHNPGSNSELFSIGYVSNVGWLAGGNTGITIESSDARTWTMLSTPFGTDTVLSVSDSGAGAIMTASNGKVAYTSPAADYASEADLLDDALAPPHGRYKTYLAGGLFRLGSPPAGRITADVTQGAAAADRTVAQIWTDVLTAGGMTSSDWSTTDVTALDTANAAVIGYWSGLNPVTCSEVASKLAQSVGAWWGVDRLGIFRIAVFGDPTGETASATFVADDMKRPLERISTADEGHGLPLWRSVIRYARNWTVQDGDLAGGVTDARRAELALEWLEASAETVGVKTAYLLAREQVDETLLAYAAAAATEAARRQTLRGVRRDRFEFAVPLDDDTAEVDVGDYVEVEHPRFGLSAGKTFVVMTVEPDAANRSMTIGVWG